MQVGSGMVKIQKRIVKIMVFFIKLYQWCIRPVIGDHCRFTPSCSVYAIEALSGCGVAKGSLLVVKRLLRCHPFSHGGYDPVNKS